MRLDRRTTFRTAVAVVALAASAALTGCGPGARSAPAPAAPVPTVAATAPAPAAPQAVVMVIRHGEKPDGTEPGLDAQGRPDESSLTRVGWDRAHRLVDLFDPAPGSARAGVDRPRAIYAAGANDEGEGKRTRETVGPLSEKLGVPVDTRFGKGDEEKLVEHVAGLSGLTLVSWSHTGIPAIAEAFPKVTPAPPAEWPDERFDVVWTFTRTADGWRFAQVPELALPHDAATVIDATGSGDDSSGDSEDADDSEDDD